MSQLKVLTLKVREQPELESFEVNQEGDTYEVISKAVRGYVEALRVSETYTL